MTYVVRITQENGFESCGYHTETKDEMEDYCIGVMANYKIGERNLRIYRAIDREIKVEYLDRQGFRVTVEGMQLVKEIPLGPIYRGKRGH